MPSTTSNMGLLIPTVGDTDYPTSVSASFTAIDDHDHSSTNGVQIVTGGITDLAVTTAKLAANAVTTAKITDLNVTRAKLVAVGQQISTSSGLVQLTDQTTLIDIPNLTVSITTTGRPVFVNLQPDNTATDGAGDQARIERLFGGDDGAICILRDATIIANFHVNAGTAESTVYAPGGFFVLDPTGAGTYTYKIQARSCATTGVLQFNKLKLVAYEL